MKNWKRLWRKWIALAMLLAVCINLALTASGIIRFGEQDHKQPCDVAIVLGAGTANGILSPVCRERVQHGIWLYENGYVSHLLFTGGYGEGSAVSDARAAMNYALDQGIPLERILIEESSTITEENLQEGKKLMESHGLISAIIVSDPLHMKRAMTMAEDFCIQAYSSPTPTTMYRTWKTKLPFLLREIFFYIGYEALRPFR